MSETSSTSVLWWVAAWLPLAGVFPRPACRHIAGIPVLLAPSRNLASPAQSFLHRSRPLASDPVLSFLSVSFVVSTV